ncbi:hypothetical protein HMI49_21105 [Corallococcus exercitus]|uniref:Uncharacterized protein n=1 Tax=Corallococcus exercitus TaxID=2316736 RepID=A0A7Y4KM36_9BACT|nr:hypothetical protein [Corallococcus exercitus]NOK35700.1 hypothetical protein [Corallococcus exercitus]
MPQVAHHAPSLLTLDWLNQNAMRNFGSRMGALEALTHIIFKKDRFTQDLPSSTLVDIFTRAGGLKYNNQLLTADQDVGELPNGEHLRTTIALLSAQDDSKETTGLIEAMPEEFLAVTFAFIAGTEAARDNRLRELLASSFDTAAAEQSNGVERTELQLLEAKLSQRSRHSLSPEDVLGHLVDDTKGGNLTAGGHEREEIITTLQGRPRETVLTPSNPFPRQFWVAALNSRSATAWALLLEVLVEHPDANPTLLDELLVRKPLYHLHGSHPALRKAIASRWSSASAETKSQILRRIEELTGSPLVNGIYCITPLLTALPETEQPAHLREYAELYRLQGWDPQPNVPTELFPTWLTPDVGEAATYSTIKDGNRTGWIFQK